jgi:hypothetical protein
MCHASGFPKKTQVERLLARGERVTGGGDFLGRMRGTSGAAGHDLTWQAIDCAERLGGAVQPCEYLSFHASARPISCT